MIEKNTIEERAERFAAQQAALIKHAMSDAYVAGWRSAEPVTTKSIEAELLELRSKCSRLENMRQEDFLKRRDLSSQNISLKHIMSESIRRLEGLPKSKIRDSVIQILGTHHIPIVDGDMS